MALYKGYKIHMIDDNNKIEFENLNSIQYEACTYKEGPAVVYAGAGSGKTKVICSRITWLIANEKVTPFSILAVTFTNKATKEIQKRIEESLGSAKSRLVTISTFHGFCAKFLRIYSKEAGFDPGFSIYDDNDQKSILKDLLKNLNIPEKILSTSTIKFKIDRIKNQGLTPEEYLIEIKNNENIINKENRNQLKNFGEFYDPELIQKIYALYQNTLKQQNAMDFNDLLLIMFKTLEKNRQVLESLQNRFHYFLVDEFQDTNPIQFKLISTLSSKTKNLFIVGDDDQSIYSWRGANPSFILNFHKFYTNAKIFKLEENYRSTDIIVNAAQEVIKNNFLRTKKNIFTQKTNGNKIIFHSCQDAQSESRFIINEIYEKYEKTKDFSEFCILYRTNSQSRSLEDELRKRMIPYIIYGSVRFYERAEIKILLSYLKIIVNSKDDVALQKVINTPRRSFGEKAIKKLKEISLSQNQSLLKILSEIVYGNIKYEITRSLLSIKDFIMKYQKWSTNLDHHQTPSLTLSEIISDINFEDFIKNTYSEDFDERLLNIIELKNALIEFENFQDNEAEKNFQKKLTGKEKLNFFIEQALLTVEPIEKNIEKNSANAVTLMTIHAAKGLEFKTIFLAGLEEGVLPHQNSLDNPDAMEEERRLMYVAITRAKENLFLTNSKTNRYKNFLPTQESRFVSEIPSKYLTIKQDFSSKEFHTNSNLNDKMWKPGQRVSHKIFGIGVINGIEKTKQGYRLKINFDKKNFGEKILIHTYVDPI
jgi:DNA helicase-2/ATP-dependent DNA helicase PcrA